jgi:capsule biosynthesis phosphatase
MPEYSYDLPPSTEQPRICFDVDGVIADHREQEHYKDRKPYPGVADRLRRLKEAGYFLVLQTARYMHQTGGSQIDAEVLGLKELQVWCDKYGIPYDEIYLGKASAVMYVDDRAFRLRSDRGESDWNVLFGKLGLPPYSE